MNRPLLPLFLTVFVDVLGLTMVIPLLPFYAQHYGASPTVVGLFLGSYAACQLVSGPILGRLSDRFGRKPVLMASQFGTVIGFLILGFAQNLTMLFLGRIIDGITAGNLTIAQATISDHTPPERRTKAYALIGISFGVGFLIGPAMSGVLADRLGYPAPAFFAAGLSSTALIVTGIMLPKRPPPAESTPSVPHRRLGFAAFLFRGPARAWLLEFLLYILAFATLIGGLALFLERRFNYDVADVGYIFGFSGLCGVVIQGGLIGRLVKRLGEEKLSMAGFVALGAGTALLGFVDSLWGLLLAIGVGSFGMSVVRPCLTTLITKSVGPKDQGAALGVSQSLGSLGNMSGPVLAGFLIGRTWLGLYGLAAASFCLLAVLFRLLRQKPPVAPSSETASA